MKKKYTKNFDPINYYSWKYLPNDLWRIFPDNLNILPENYPLEKPEQAKIEPLLPVWLSEEGKQEIFTHEKYTQTSLGAWIANVYARVNNENHNNIYFKNILMAQVLMYGLTTVAEDLLKSGACLQPLPPPNAGEISPNSPAGWDFIEVAKRKNEHISVLNICVGAMFGNATNTPLPPEHKDSLLWLLSKGSNPNEIDGATLREAVKREPIVSILIEAGLNPWVNTASQGYPYTPLFKTLIDNNVTLAVAARHRILQRFLNAGMSKSGPDGRDIVTECCNTPIGILMIERLAIHFGNEIKDELNKNRDLIFKKYKRKDPQTRIMIEQVMMDAQTLNVSNTHKKPSRL